MTLTDEQKKAITTNLVRLSQLSLEELSKLRNDPKTPKEMLWIIKDLMFAKTYRASPEKLRKIFENEK